LILVEDAAQACGASYKGRAVGTIGSFGAFSFNRDKIISCGEGGLLVIGSKDFEVEAKRAFISHDTPSQFGLTMKEELASAAGFFGLSTRMNEISAAMLRQQLIRLPLVVKTLRHRKIKLMSTLEERGLNLRRGHDCSGDNGSVVHIFGADPLYTVAATKLLVKNGIRAMSPTMRPAHASWQWVGAMASGDYYVKGLNPFSLTSKKYEYPKADFIQSIQILGSTLRIPIPNAVECREEDFASFCDQVADLLASV
jgi:8-amino-3,8-dideoxy-alpha-D-manno-octulosonate transaminase